jgi:hypothetical protein
MAQGECALVQLVHMAFPLGAVALNLSNWDLFWLNNFSRASTATFTDIDGLLKTAAVNVPRVNYLVDGATNLLPYSQQFDSWTPNGLTVTADAMVAPDGSSRLAQQSR